ncbi:MAG: esterase [Acidobacteria bacterium]|nr:esterase [Acidobacteriota bacterium]
MISKRMRVSLFLALSCGLAGMSAVPASSDSARSQVVERELRSKNIENNKAGVDPVRKMLVYLPAGYDKSSSQRYPVIYFLPNPFEASYRFDFDHRDAQGLFDRAIAKGVINRFILVAVDMNTPLGSSWYVNSSATGNWEDFMIQELVPYIDANFKTIPHRDSRGIAGIFIGGYGAIRFGMRRPDVFGSVYAMHPVGTGTGVRTSAAIPKWDILANAKSMDDAKKDGVTRIFATMFQAHLPNPEKAPLFVDLLARQDGDRLIIDAKLMERFRNNFYLETMIPQYADNLNSLRGFKFDWTRTDANFDHVYANQSFTRKLNEFGVRHEAEEYNGAFGADWGVDGRFYTDALPFFQRLLVSDRHKDTGHD